MNFFAEYLTIASIENRTNNKKKKNKQLTNWNLGTHSLTIIAFTERLNVHIQYYFDSVHTQLVSETANHTDTRRCAYIYVQCKCTKIIYALNATRNDHMLLISNERKLPLLVCSTNRENFRFRMHRDYAIDKARERARETERQRNRESERVRE